MNYSRSILLLIKTLEDHVVAGLLFLLDELVLVAASLYHKGVGFFANFALESLPEERTEIGRDLGLAFDFEPGLQAGEVDRADRTCAAATL